jgi:hypothetical protein
LEVAKELACTDIWLDCCCLIKTNIEWINDTRLLTIAEVYETATAGLVFAREIIEGETHELSQTMWNTRLWTQQELYFTRNMTLVNTSGNERKPIKWEYPSSLGGWCEYFLKRRSQHDEDYWKCLQSVLKLFTFNELEKYGFSITRCLARIGFVPCESLCRNEYNTNKNLGMGMLEKDLQKLMTSYVNTFGYCLPFNLLGVTTIFAVSSSSTEYQDEAYPIIPGFLYVDGLISCGCKVPYKYTIKGTERRMHIITKNKLSDFTPIRFIEYTVG